MALILARASSGSFSSRSRIIKALPRAWPAADKHGADIDIYGAGNVADGTDHTLPVHMVDKEEGTFGRDKIDPVVVSTLTI